MMWLISSFNAGSVFRLLVNRDSNSSHSHRLFARRATLLVSFLVAIHPDSGADADGHERAGARRFCAS